MPDGILRDYERCMEIAEFKKAGRGKKKAECRRKLILNVIYEKGGVASFDAIWEVWEATGLQKEYLYYYLGRLVKEHRVRHLGRGVYSLTPWGAEYIKKEHPLGVIEHVRAAIMLGDSEKAAEGLKWLENYLKKVWGVGV